MNHLKTFPGKAWKKPDSPSTSPPERGPWPIQMTWMSPSTNFKEQYINLEIKIQLVLEFKKIKIV
jgi:hypothetical protein